MGKDRYSDDHTIEVVGGTNTVNVKENLIVENNLTVENNINVSGDLNSQELSFTNASGTAIEVDSITCQDIFGKDILGDTILSISSDNISVQAIGVNLDVGTINFDDSLDVSADNSITLTATDSLYSYIELDSPTIKFTSTPELSSVDTRYMSYPPSCFEFRFTDNVPGNPPALRPYGDFWIIDEQSDFNYLFCPINNIPQGATIVDLTIYYSTGDSSDEIHAGLFGIDFSDSNNTIEYFYQELPTGAPGWTSDSVTPTSIPTIDYQTMAYFIKFYSKNGTGTELFFGGARITYLTKSVGL